jgi:hypothetical protein
MSWLLRLYPAAWRERYGAEFVELLARERMTPALLVDVLGGALDARLHPQPKARRAAAAGPTGGKAMVGGLSFRCAGFAPMSKSEAWRSAAILVGGTAALALLRNYLDLTVGSSVWVEAVGLAAFIVPLAWWTTTQMRDRTWRAKGAVFAVALALALLGAWAAKLT